MINLGTEGPVWEVVTSRGIVITVQCYGVVYREGGIVQFNGNFSPDEPHESPLAMFANPVSVVRVK